MLNGKVCKKNNKLLGIIFGLGIFSLVIGIVMCFTLPEDAGNYNHFAGMLSGFGTGILAVAIIKTLKDKFTSKEKLEQKEIEQNDERNIEISRMSYTIVATASYIIFAILSMVFSFLGYGIATWLCIAAIYIEVIIFFISYKIFEKKI
ncbi:MAG: hypothetical protein PHC41_15190 [Lachnospiraceae bacterium]|nr:hypothetical protein [Lachnospiraceae bacterium]MDD3617548.1 hypothetical protein [Lachnospiraceae bacterium]